MENYRKGAHTVHTISYYFVWITKYRYNVLSGNHIHLLVSTPPTLAPSKVAQLLKGKLSFKIQQEFSELKKRYWGQHIWARGYFCASSGNVSDEMVKEYIENHKSQKTDDDFIVE